MPSEAAPKRGLIVDPAFLGDAVFDAALARAVKQRWPDCEVGLVLRPPSDRLGPFMPFVDRVHRFDKRGADRGRAGLERVADEIAQFGYDVAWIPHPSFRSTWLAARARIPTRIGSAPGWLARRPLTIHRPADPDDGFVAARLRLLEAAHDRPPDPRLAGALRVPDVGPPPEHRRIGLVLGSEWATKRWPIPRAIELIEGLADADEVVLLGAPSERELYDELLAKVGDEVRRVDAVGEPIEGLVERIAGCDVLIAGDTGPLHIARALGVPCVALFGPTDPGRHVPGIEDRVLTVDLACRPCGPHGAARCPEGHHRCLVDLTGDRVRGAVVDVLERSRS